MKEPNGSIGVGVPVHRISDPHCIPLPSRRPRVTWRLTELPGPAVSMDASLDEPCRTSGVLRERAISIFPSIGKFGSKHPAGIQVVMGDGAVRAITSTVEAAVLRRVCMRNDREVVSLPN